MCKDENGELDLDFSILVMDELDAEDRGLLGLPGESVLVYPVNKDDVTQCIEVWYGNSAVSRHVARMTDALYDFTPSESVLKTANGNKLRVLGRGSLDLGLILSGTPTTVSSDMSFTHRILRATYFLHDLPLFALIPKKVREISFFSTSERE